MVFSRIPRVFPFLLALGVFVLIFLVLFIPTTSFLSNVSVEASYTFLLGCLILLALLSGRLLNSRAWGQLFQQRWLFWLALFVGWLIFLSLIQPEGWKDIHDFQGWLLVTLFVLVIYLIWPKSYQWIPVCFLLIGLINSIAGSATWMIHRMNPTAAQVVSSDPTIFATGYGFYYWIGGILPVAGLRDNIAINQMADLLFWPFMILLGCFSHKKLRWLIFAGLLMIGAGIFVTYSRATAIAMGVGVIGFLVCYFLPTKGISVWKGILSSGIFIGVLCVAVLLLPNTISGSVFFRFGFWEQILLFIQNNPFVLLIGGGFPQIGAYGVWDSHNMYLYVLIQYGIPGFLLFSAMIISIFRENNHSRWIFSRQSFHTESAAVVGALAGFLVRGFAESQMNELDLKMAFILFLLYAAAVLHGSIGNEQTQNIMEAK
jgi:hypothetical protein